MKAVLTALLAGAMGCAFVQPVSAADAGKYQEKLLYSFCNEANCEDGYNPDAGLIDVKGKLYGTTPSGGHGESCQLNNGCGTAFSFDPVTGKESVLYSFCNRQNCPDGSEPLASLIDVKGKLYGTTTSGGAQAQGTVFAIDTHTGAETVIYSFCSQTNCADGANPSASLIDVKGTLYGTTTNGGGTGCGGNGCGTVFALDPATGVETVVYAFCTQQSCTDAVQPGASLIDAKGELYGTTQYGGANNGGTVFAVNPKTGDETVLYSFCSQTNCTDGQYPIGNVINVKGMLYGTTSAGGANNGKGTVFAVDPNTGNETVVYAFCSQQNCTDGSDPSAGLLDVNGLLYGTTFQAGGAGNVFAIDPSTGTEAVVVTFDNTNGQWPLANLIDAKGTLYGTTFAGGVHGLGILFALKKR